VLNVDKIAKKTNTIYFDFSRKRENRRKENLLKRKRAMPSGHLEPDDREGPARISAWSQLGYEPLSEIDCGSNMQELMERGHLWRSRRRWGVLLYFILMK
jgi:hypothetical protein